MWHSNVKVDPTHQMTVFSFVHLWGNRQGAFLTRKQQYMSPAGPGQCYIFLSVLEDLCNLPFLVLTAYSLLNRRLHLSAMFPKYALSPLCP